MLAKIRKFNVVPFRLTALVLLAMVIVTLLVACVISNEKDPENGSPNLTILPPINPSPTITTCLLPDNPKLWQCVITASIRTCDSPLRKYQSSVRWHPQG